MTERHRARYAPRGIDRLLPAELGVLKSTVQEGIAEALQTVETSFDNARNPDDRLVYHCRRHTEGVINRTQRIFRAMRGAGVVGSGEREEALATLAAAFHDTVQKWEEKVDPKTGYVMRTRPRTFGNEEASYAKAKAFMDAANAKVKASGTVVFTAEDYQRVEEAILVTIPDYDKGSQTVFQPNLDKGNNISSPIARAVALADLGEAGMEDARAGYDASMAVFREENLDIARTIQNRNKTPLSADQKEKFHLRMRAFIQREVAFVEGRQTYFNKETYKLGEEGQAAVRAEFRHFADAVAYRKKRLIDSHPESFETLARDFGYDI